MGQQIQISGAVIEAISPLPGEVSLRGNGIDLYLPGAVALPGFADSHGHVQMLGELLSGANLGKCRSAGECVREAMDNAIRRGPWVFAHGWNQERWQDKRLPDRSELDRVFSSIPVCLVRVDWHAMWLNSAALKICGIGKESDAPTGGQIICDRQGQPTGLLVDKAMDIVWDKLPDYSMQQRRAFILKALENLASYGLTEVHDMATDKKMHQIFQELDREGQLSLKVISYLHKPLEKYTFSGNYDSMYRPIGIKLFADGALGSRGAALFEPYSDDNSSSGLLLMDRNDIYSRAKQALCNGFDVAVHAIGDRSNHELVMAFSRLYNEGDLPNGRKLRMEHVQMLRQKDLELIKKYPVILSVQPLQSITDIQGMAQKRTGRRIKYSYRWQSLSGTAPVISAGSDFPVEPPDCLAGIGAFTGNLPDNINSPEKAELLSTQQAIHAYTRGPRLAYGGDALAGTLSAGAPADITVVQLPKNSGSIADGRVVATIAAGKLIFHSGKGF